MFPRRSKDTGLIALFLAWTLLATVASVPTSVLVQNSELASNAQQNHAKSMQMHNAIGVGVGGVALTKVKRSSGPSKNEAATAANSNAADSAAMDKKSSPEIVPASYVAPQKPRPSLYAQQPRDMNAGDIGQPSNFEKNNDLISSAIAAGLTAAAVEAAAVAANQHELEQLRKQHQLYADDADGDEPSNGAINKRGITPQQYGYQPLMMPDMAYAGNQGFQPAPNAAMYYNPYGNYEAVPMVNDVPQGVWSDDWDPSNVVYTDIDDYAPVARVPSYRNKAYDNLQSILNSESYLEPAAVPLPYTNAGRYYSSALDSDRNKRAYKVFNQLANKFPDMRLKRDTKLTPADMLALVALVEAGERARKDTDTDAGYTMYPAENYVPKTYGFNGNSNNNNNNYNAGGLYEYPGAAMANQMDESLDYNNGGWQEQPQAMMDYYGMPMSMEPMPKYETAAGRENKYNERFFNNKQHFMVSKKKRSIAKPVVPYKQDKLY